MKKLLLAGGTTVQNPLQRLSSLLRFYLFCVANFLGFFFFFFLLINDYINLYVHITLMFVIKKIVVLGFFFFFPFFFTFYKSYREILICKNLPLFASLFSQRLFHCFWRAKVFKN